MKNKNQTKPLTMPVLYRIIRGVSFDTLNERHEAGAEGVDLSAWPPKVVAQWVKRGIVEVMNE